MPLLPRALAAVPRLSFPNRSGFSIHWGATKPDSFREQEKEALKGTPTSGATIEMRGDPGHVTIWSPPGPFSRVALGGRDGGPWVAAGASVSLSETRGSPDLLGLGVWEHNWWSHLWASQWLPVPASTRPDWLTGGRADTTVER